MISSMGRAQKKRLLRSTNFSRVVSLAHFSAYISEINLPADPRIAVVSGDGAEPELEFLSGYVDFFKYPEFDLDTQWQPIGSYDLVLCNQVLEHIFSPIQAVKNLRSLSKPGGYLYLTVPTLNCIHGEPEFYSAGYHPRFLRRLAEQSECELVKIGWWGSRSYIRKAVLGTWLTTKQVRRRQWRFLDSRWNTPGTGNEQDISDCWALLRVPDYFDAGGKHEAA